MVKKKVKAVGRKIGEVGQKFTNLYEQARGGRLGKRAERLYKQGMFGLEPGSCYWDPTGARVEGGVNLAGAPGGLKEMIDPAIQEYQKAVDGGYPFEEAVWAYRKMASKTLQSSTWNIPIYAVRGTPIVSRGALPLTTLMSRIVTDKDEIQTTPLTTLGATSNIGETDASYTYTDDTYFGGTVTNYAFAIKGYGRGNKVSELMSMVGGNINNPRQTLAEAELLSIRQYEETQIIQGIAGGDASGFKGLQDWSAYGDFGYLKNMAGGALTSPDDIRLAIDTLIAGKGANPDTVIGVTDQATYTAIKNDLQDYVKTADPHKNFERLDPVNNINIRLRGLDIDGTMIYPSHGSPTTSGSREINFIDLQDHYMGMVQDATLKPLAFIGPHEDMATDAYGTCVSEGFGHCGRIYNIL